MDPAQQVKEIIMLMCPEDPGTQTDAVFLVRRYMEQTREKINGKDKQIALLEADLEKRSKEKEDIINAKLKSEANLKKEISELETDSAIRKAVIPTARKDKSL